MKEISEQTFGEYVETLRRKADRSLRKCAAAIGVSAQFFSEVEKNRRTAFTTERIESLVTYLHLGAKEKETLLNKAAENRKTPEFDFSDYIVKRDYAMAALRKAKELNADEEDWLRFVDDLMKRKGD
jgi:transcriptional regulator with XRE-family HTH domain